MSKTCHEAIELMNLYLDGRLSGGQYQELSGHLEGCEHCRKRMNYLRVISSELRKDRPAMPDDLHNHIMNHIARANAPAEPKRFPVKKLQKILALCAAALVLVLVTPAALNSIGVGETASGVSTAQNETWFHRLFANLFSNASDETSGDPQNDGTTVDQDQSNSGQSDTSGDSSDSSHTGSTANRTEGTYTVPALRTNERFADYIVATGTVEDLSAYFDLSSVAVYPEDNSIYIPLSNDANSLAKVYTSIRSMGLTLHLNPKGLPETDENAPEILFVIFPQ